MTRKQQIAKKAAKAAAIATYKAILNPPVWKVAGTSFKTSPTWEDIAKAAAAASYGAVIKIAQTPIELPEMVIKGKKPGVADTGSVEDVVIKQPLVVKGPKKPGATDIGSVLMEKVDDFDVFKFKPTLENERLANAPNFANWLFSQYGSGQLPADAKNFADYVKTGGHGEDWAFAANWPRITSAIYNQIKTNDPQGVTIGQLNKLMA